MDQAQTTALGTALQLVKETRLEEARVLLAEIIRRDPNNEQAWHLLSFALTDPDQQAYALRRVLAINPENRAARSQLSRIAGAASPSAPPPAAPEPARTRREIFPRYKNHLRLDRPAPHPSPRHSQSGPAWSERRRDPPSAPFSGSSSTSSSGRSCCP